MSKRVSVSKIKEYGRELEARLPKDYKHEVYRKGIHLSSLWIPLIIYFCGKIIASSIFIFLMIVELVLEYGNYKKWPWARFLFTIPSLLLLRNKERQRQHFTVTGGVYVLGSALICTLLYSNVIAAISLTVMLISDTLAALVGKAIGLRKIYKNKTLEGTTAFFVSALIITMLFNPLYTFNYASVIACFVAMFLELFEQWFELDDNFSVPLAIGTVLTILA